MNKKQIDALNNFAGSLDDLIQTLTEQYTKKNDGGGAASVSSMNILESTLSSISAGIKELKDTSKEILDNTKTLLKIKEEKKKETSLFGSEQGKSNIDKIKSGVSSIILIAGSILLLGAAFKLVGDVDPISVLSLGITIFILSETFAKIASIPNLTTKAMVDVGKTMFILSLAILASSYILSYVEPISPIQALSAIGIAGIFVVISYSVANLMRATKDMKMKDLLMLPLTLVAISTAIVASSYIMSLFNPVDNLMGIFLFSTTLALASVLLAIPLYIFGSISLNTLLQGAIALVGISMVIALSSHIISYGDYSNYIPIGWSLGFSLSMILLSIPVLILGAAATSGIGAAAIGLGIVSIIAIAGGIALSSHIIATGNYKNFPNASWSTGFGLNMLLLSLPILILGAAAMTGIGAIAIGLGIKAILDISTAIATSSHILALGNYSKYPTASWSAGVGNAIGAFAPVLNTLTSLKITDIFTGKNSDNLIPNTITAVANSIISAAHEFNKYDQAFSKYPSVQWSSGVSGAIGAFLPLINKITGMGQILDFFTGQNSVKKITDLISGVSSAIRISSEELSKATYDVYPSMEWSKGVSTSIGAFLPLINKIFDQGFFSSLLTNKSGDVLNTISGIGKSIATFSTELSKGKYIVYPSVEYGNGVLMFMKSYEMIGTKIKSLKDKRINSADFKSIIENMNTITQQMGGIDTASNMDQLQNYLPTISGLTSEFDKLTSSIDSLNNSLTQLSQNNGAKLLYTVTYDNNTPRITPILGNNPNIRTVTPNVVDILDKNQNETQNKNSQNIGENVSSDSKMDEMIGVLKEINANISGVRANTSTVSTLLNELKMKNTMIELKK